jgi:hypothetical protein
VREGERERGREREREGVDSSHPDNNKAALESISFRKKLMWHFLQQKCFFLKIFLG